MKPSTIGVDYLAYEWQPSELIICHREMRHQMTELSAKIRRPNDRRTTKILESDYVRLTRYQNAVWRQMANRCTDSLGSKNAVLDPKAIQWEKEADLTWLYGPLYNTKINNVPHRRATHGLKSALKPYDPNPLSSTRSLPTRSANEVRFDPEIRRILYHSDLPPTHDSLKEKIRAKTLDDYCAEMNEGDDDDDDLVYECTLWVRQKILSLHFLASHRSRIDSVPCARPRDLVILIIRILQLMAGATAMWMVYQSLLPVRWLTRPAKSHTLK